MKKSKFQINVWDLLLSAWKRDQIIFENEKLEALQNLWPNGISWKIIIQSFNEDSLLTTLEDLNCTIVEPCDKCTTVYNREILIPEYQAKFQTKIDPKEESDDETYLIDKNENIDIQDMILNAIKLEEPFIKKCPKCQQDESDELEDEEDDFDSIWLGNIQFR